jgi:tetratricopeptide (TPR) repeat protein
MAQVYKRFDNEKAEQAYKTAISINPYLQDAYFSFGEFYWSIKKFDEAADNIKKGLEFQNIESYYTSAIQSGIKTYTELPEVIANFKILLAQGTSDENMQKYDSMVFNHYYLKNNSYIAEKYDQVGYYYLKRREFSEAAEYFEKSIQCWDSKKNRAYNHLDTVNNKLKKK